MSVTFTAGTEDWNEEFQAIVCSTTSPEDGCVNMSNSNAANVCQALGIDVSGVPAGEAIITEVSPEEMDLVARYMVANDDFDSTDWN